MKLMKTQNAFGIATVTSLLLCATTTASAAPDVWTLRPGCATSNAGNWVIGCDAPVSGGRAIYHWTGVGFPQVPNGSAVDITTSTPPVDNSGGSGSSFFRYGFGTPQGTPWVVSTIGHVYKWNGTTWPDFGGNTCEGSVPVCARHDQYGTSTIGVGPTDTSAWIIDCAGSGGNYYIRQWSGTCWQLKGGMATQIAVDPQGNPWVITASNTIYRWVSGAWQLVSGGATSISAFGGTVAVIGTDNNRYVWNGSQFTVTRGQPAGITLSQIYNTTDTDTLGRIWDLYPGTVKGHGDITGDKKTDVAIMGGAGW